MGAKAEGAKDKNDQKELLSAQKERMESVKNMKRRLEEKGENEDSDDDDDAADNGEARPLAKSKYPEDKYILGHQTVWGSWWNQDEKRWGFRCCKVLDRELSCPEAPDDETAGG